MKIVILGEPRTKKNSQQILINHSTGRPFVSQSPAYKQYEHDAAWQVWQAWHNRPPIETKVNVKCVFYMKTHRKVDLTNLLGAIDDILTKFSVLKDDNCNIVGGHDGSRVKYDKDNPRVEIDITELGEEE